MSELEALWRIIDGLETAVHEVKDANILRAYVSVKVKQARAIQQDRAEQLGEKGATGVPGKTGPPGYYALDPDVYAVMILSDAITPVEFETEETMIDEQRFLQIAAKVMADESDLPVLITIKDAWVLIAGIQAVNRHPALPGRTKDHLEAIARAFQERIVELHPEAGELLEMGWKKEHDIVPRKFNKNQRH